MFGTTDEVMALLGSDSDRTIEADDSRISHEGCSLDLECQCAACRKADRETDDCIRAVMFAPAPVSPWRDKMPSARVAPVSARLLLSLLAMSK
jgi:hypothetical protein